MPLRNDTLKLTLSPHVTPNTISDCSRTSLVAIASFGFDFGSYENITGTHKETREAFPFEAVVGRHDLFAVDVWRT